MGYNDHVSPYKTWILTGFAIIVGGFLCNRVCRTDADDIAYIASATGGVIAGAGAYVYTKGVPETLENIKDNLPETVKHNVPSWVPGFDENKSDGAESKKPESDDPSEGG